MVQRSEVVAYALQHGVIAASAKYGIQERTIRKWRAKLAPASNRAVTVQASSVASGAGRVVQAQAERGVSLVPPAPMRSIIPHENDVADGVTEWRVPAFAGAGARREIPQAGTLAKEWLANKLLTPTSALPVHTPAPATPANVPASVPAPAIPSVPARIVTRAAHTGPSARISAPVLPAQHNKTSLLIPAVKAFQPSLVERVPPWVWLIVSFILCLLVFRGL